MHWVHFENTRAGWQLPGLSERLTNRCAAAGEYLGGYRVRIANDGYSRHLADADSDDERGGRTTPPEGNSDVVVVPRPPSSF